MRFGIRGQLIAALRHRRIQTNRGHGVLDDFHRAQVHDDVARGHHRQAEFGADGFDHGAVPVILGPVVQRQGDARAARCAAHQPFGLPLDLFIGGVIFGAQYKLAARQPF